MPEYVNKKYTSLFDVSHNVYCNKAGIKIYYNNVHLSSNLFSEGVFNQLYPFFSYCEYRAIIIR